MRVRYLGWAGAELGSGSSTVVIDPLEDARAVFAPLGEPGERSPRPHVVPATPGVAAAGLVTHLHRDHADAAALFAALRPGAPVLEPAAADRDAFDDLALAQADAELTAAGLDRRALAAGDSVALDDVTVTALPAADGVGDPQVSWLVDDGAHRVLHLGDTMWHGAWWRMARRHGPFDVVLVPVNGAVVGFPHRRPAAGVRPAVLGPEEAAAAVDILGARLAIPIHAEGYAIPGVYTPEPDAVTRFVDAARERDVAVHVLAPGETLA
jgi:L-ascorbate metabolism protein UlaG (beta-lactamase superfamily)